MKKTAVILILMLTVVLVMLSGTALASTLKLPESTVCIEEEAFYGTDASIIVLPKNVQTIGDRAFGGSDTLLKVYVPDELMNREDAALEGSPNARFVYIPGFITRDNGYTYYRNEDGEYLKGFHTIDGRLYCFSQSSGVVLTGFRTIDENKYYFDPEHYYAVTGFCDIEDYTFYFGEDGRAYMGGYYEIDGAEYYFNQSGTVAKGPRTINGVSVLFDQETGQLLTGFYTDSNSLFRYYYDGKNGMLQNGVKTINGAVYYFYSNGVMARGLTTINGKKYYFDWNTGKRVTGLVDLGMEHYMFFGEDGSSESGFINCNGIQYYFDPETWEAVSGFITVDGNTYYFSPETYAMVTGFVQIDNSLYYFAKNGKLRTGNFSLSGKNYIADQTGKIKTGQFAINGIYYKSNEQTGELYTGFYQTEDTHTTYYYDGANGRVTGKCQIGGDWYYFNDNGFMKFGMQSIDGVKWYFDPDTGKAVNGFVDYNGNRYLAANGIIQSGLIKKDGKIYLLADGTGTALTGFQQDSENALYYFDRKTYAALTGWQEIAGSLYYFDEDGKAYSDGIYEIGGYQYYFSSGAVVQKGKKTVDGVNYYFSQKTGKRTTGLITIGENMYCFIPENNKTDYDGFAKGLRTINGKKYYFSEKYGHAQAGYVKVGEDVYFFDKYTKQGITGIVSANGNTYYAENGKVDRSGLRTIDNTVYVFRTTSGSARTNVMTADGDGVYRYFDENGANLYGLITYNDKEYYFYKDGGRATETEKNSLVSQLEQAANGFSTIGGVTYYKASGKIVKGFKTINGSRYYFSQVNGAMMTGFRLINGYYYYFGNDGKMKTGSVALERGECQFDSTGKMLTGKNGDVYYTETGMSIDGYAIGENGTVVSGNSTFTGFKTINGEKYYFSNGTALTGMQTINGKKYYFANDGIMRTGLVTVDGVKMYFDKDSGVQKTGFITKGNAVYYYDETAGRLSGLQEINGDRYYFDSRGIRLSGIVTVGSNKYYFDESTGKMKYGLTNTSFGTIYANPSTGKLQTGFVTTGGKTYYFWPSGYTIYTMATGWVTIGENRYYMNADGVKQQGFIEIDGSTFYLYSDHLATGLTAINGHEYFFSDGGKMQKGRVKTESNDYFFDTETGARIIGLVQIGQYYYGFLEDGTLGEGTVIFDDGKEYFFNEKNHYARLGLYSAADGKLHYYDVNEGMYKNKTWTLDGVTYTADEYGVVQVAAVNSTFAEIVNNGIQYLGTPYGNEGFVCSSFVTQILNDTFTHLELKVGYPVQYIYTYFTDFFPEAVSYNKSDLQLGDLVFYVKENCDEGDNCETVGELHHVGIYIGSGKMMEATSFPGMKDPETGEKYGYTLIWNLVENDQYSIIAVVHTLQIADKLDSVD